MGPERRGIYRRFFLLFPEIPRRAEAEGYFRYHFLLGADWKLCTRKLGDGPGAISSTRSIGSNKNSARCSEGGSPYSLFPLDESFHGPSEARTGPRLAWRDRASCRAPGPRKSTTPVAQDRLSTVRCRLAADFRRTTTSSPCIRVRTPSTISTRWLAPSASASRNLLRTPPKAQPRAPNRGHSWRRRWRLRPHAQLRVT